MKKNIFLYACLLIALSCSKGTDNKDGGKVIHINLSGNIEEKRLQDIASSITMVQLEEVDEYPVGVINKMIVTNRDIYILDWQHAHCLFIYGRDGSFKRVIDKVGTGPGEFTTPSDFAIEKGTGNIIILDGNQRKFIVYSKTGDYLYEIRQNYYMFSFVLRDNEDIIIDQGNTSFDPSNKYLHVINRKGKRLNDFIDIPGYLKEMTVSPREPLQTLNDTILFLPSLSNKIYNVYEDSVQVRYSIDFEHGWPNRNFFENMKGEHPLKIGQTLSASYVAFLNFLENRSILYLTFSYKKEQYSYYLNKATGQDILCKVPENEVPLTTTNLEFVTAIYPEDLNPRLIFYTVKWDE